jgi:hypothetical protein
VGAAPELEEGILRGLFSQHWGTQNAECQAVNAADIAIVQGKESAFVTLSYTFNQLFIVNFWHTSIVPNLGCFVAVG